MIAPAMVVLHVASCAFADLIAVSGGSGIVFRLSTTDASLTELATTEVPVFELALAPDGAYYATTFEHCLQFDPTTGAYDVAFEFGDALATGGVSVSSDGFAYAGFFGPIPGAGLFVWDPGDKAMLPSVLFSEYFWVHAMIFRSDKSLIATQPEDPTIYEIDLETADITPIGAIDETLGFVWGFAQDAASGRAYMLAGRKIGPRSLYAFDLHTLKPTLIGELPPAPKIHGIAAIACAADFNADGALNILDFIAFQLAWQAGDPAADVNADGALDILDFVAFQSLFQEGCR